MRFGEIRVAMYKTGITLIDLGVFMVRHNCEFHRPGKFQSGNIRVEMTVRMLSKKSFEPYTVCDHTMVKSKALMVSPKIVEKHRIDSSCVILPVASEFDGAYRYLGDDDVPVLTMSNTCYIRCPNEKVAITLQSWLSTPAIVNAIREEGVFSSSDIKTALQSVPIMGKLQSDDVDTRIVNAGKRLLSLAREVKELRSAKGKMGYSIG